ncbi:MAG: hypothetical protein WCG19_10505 [Chlorobiaceae bacterium]
MKKLSLYVIAAMMLITTKAALATAPDVTIINKESIGSYLADANGKALYWTKKDSPGKSNVSGEMLENWAPFFCGAVLSAAPEMNAKDFGTIVRNDGKKQNTFRGYPIYYFTMDQQAEDTKGQNVNKTWQVIKPGEFHLTEQFFTGYSMTVGTNN